MAAFTQEQIQSRHKPLDFTYRDYTKINKNLENIKIKQYCFLQQIGQGAFAQVYKATNQHTNQLVAIKVLDLRNIETEQSIRVKAIRKRLAKQESKIMMKFNCPNLLKCYECLENRDLKFMVIEYCSEGSLQDKIDTMKRIPEFQAINILKQIINGIGECHKQKIIHRDLKAQNILCKNGEYKIADFGFSKELRIDSEDELSRNTCLGTMTTMAPEVLKRQNYGLKADIWSIGVIFFQMLFGECPFKSNTSAEMITEIMSNRLLKNEEYKGVIPSPEASKFIREVLVVDINKRLGWREILEHDLFKKKVEALPATFNRRMEIKDRDQELEDLERDFFKEGGNDLSALNLSFATSENLKPEESFYVSDYASKKESPVKETENFNKKKFEDEGPVFKIEEFPSAKKKQEKAKEAIQKKEEIEQKPQIQDIHATLEEKMPHRYLNSGKNGEGQKFEEKHTFKKLNSEQVQKIKDAINKEDAQIYKWATRIHLQCLKTECIFNSIIKPIEKYNLLDLTSRHNIEMMYLISTRCMNNISPISFEYEKRKNNPIIRDIHLEIESLYKDVVDTWLVYSNLLTEKENEKITMIKDWFSKKLSKQQIKMKDRFLTGVEDMAEFRPEGGEEKKVKPSKMKEEDLKDYDKEEQIDFTWRYIEDVMKELKETNRVKDVKSFLTHYRDICRIESEDLKTKSFGEHLALIMM